jgi:ubiquinone/menaquinone biosynthesis C-methylase UbiE
MNRFENWFCASRAWRTVTRKQLLPWLLAGTELGEHVLEIGAGPGAATEELRKRSGRVTSLEYSYDFAARLAPRDQKTTTSNVPGAKITETRSRNGVVVQGDASVLPFAESTFSTAVAILVLHHLRTHEAQERALREIFRVLRPGGAFLAVEIEDGWLNRIAHIRSTFVPLRAREVPARFAAAGFCDVTYSIRHGAFRVKAVRPNASDKTARATLTTHCTGA